MKGIIGLRVKQTYVAEQRAVPGARYVRLSDHSHLRSSPIDLRWSYISVPVYTVSKFL